ncbi:MAG: hypothetical protein ACREXY_15600, partial [Gammaproteobacteria bacterium]
MLHGLPTCVKDRDITSSTNGLTRRWKSSGVRARSAYSIAAAWLPGTESLPAGINCRSILRMDRGRWPATRAAGVRYFRVHDVKANRQAADVAWAI